MDLNDEIKELPDETSIYKYIDIDSFNQYILEKETLLFRNVKKWRDSDEGVMQSFIQRNKKEEEHVYLGSCWSLEQENMKLYTNATEKYANANAELSKYGSDAMWQIYCRNGGVRVKTTIGKLKDRIESDNAINLFKHASVAYLTKKMPSNSYRLNVIDNALFMKKVPFRHEMEYRFIITTNENLDSQTLKIALFDLFDEFLISPATHEDALKSIKFYKELVSRQPNKSNGTNRKNGRFFCRISQLYGNISQVI